MAALKLLSLATAAIFLLDTKAANASSAGATANTAVGVDCSAAMNAARKRVGFTELTLGKEATEILPIGSSTDAKVAGASYVDQVCEKLKANGSDYRWRRCYNDRERSEGSCLHHYPKCTDRKHRPIYQLAFFSFEDPIDLTAYTGPVVPSIHYQQANAMYGFIEATTSRVLGLETSIAVPPRLCQGIDAPYTAAVPALYSSARTCSTD
ncbi:SAG family member [Eimeria brunetti]|uniref:SAG family member n=1 Tax=Eimeria brunetti TaxID=51314 RepID=U6LM16_9EIME|nr:SAG family member [Eimeria brunetti]